MYGFPGDPSFRKAKSAGIVSRDRDDVLFRSERRFPADNPRFF